VRVFGISFDNAAENRAFAEKFGYTFPLLCDVERKVGLAYGACKSEKDRYPARITYVVGPDGKIEQAIETKDPAGQAAALLAAIPVR
jgi:peroxiredoxin Q/BCP